MAGLSAKLTSLVEAAEDPNLFLFALLRLDDGSPMPGAGPDGGFAKRVHELRNSLAMIPGRWQAKLQQQQAQLLQEKTLPLILDQKERQLTVLLFQHSALGVFIRHLPVERPEALRKLLRKGNPLIRLLVITAIGRRHLHFEKDLIDALNTPQTNIREAAHLALVRCSRGTDFGPISGASQRGIERSIEKWKHWLALQESQSPEALSKEAAIVAAGQPTPVAPLAIVPLVLVPEDPPAVPAAVTKASDELLHASGSEQTAALTRLRDAADSDSIEAIALAIPKLSGDIQHDARDALTASLTHLSAAALRDKLQDDRLEVRCAAALACGRKVAREHIADLVQLLDDPEMDVVQSARVALTELTGEDFGPTRDAGGRGREEAVAAWRTWWKKHQDSGK